MAISQGESCKTGMHPFLSLLSEIFSEASNALHPEIERSDKDKTAINNFVLKILIKLCC
jgi:hypothetical protein